MSFNISPKVLAELIKKGETRKVEFKSLLPPDNISARILTAFANSEGGVLILGVSEQGEITGLTRGQVHQATERLRRITASLFDTPAEVGSAVIDGRPVVHAAIEAVPKDTPPVTTASGAAYQRRGAGVIELGIDDIIRRLEQRKTVKRGTPARPTRRTEQHVKAFVAMSFRTEEEPALEDYWAAMKRAVEQTDRDIELVRIDLHDGDYEISQEIMDKIDKCSILIADFTLSPSNVYFELGYARGQGKRVIQTARKETTLA
ncbi:MAG: putative DNA binding domain-containing protein, partial [Chloroflexi bacterium]|nr:putative DNA binding domain-containing protein [Chloroflexota bacterium]